MSHAVDIRPISMKFTRSTLNDPKHTHTKMILFEKDYHINFDIEQKRPLPLARSVHKCILTAVCYAMFALLLMHVLL